MSDDPLAIFRQLPPGFQTCMISGTFLLWGIFWAIFAAIFQRNLATVPEGNRRLRPGHVWWLVVFPVSLVWLFVVVHRISDSWKSYFHERGDDSHGTCGKKAGLTSAVLAVISNLLSIQPYLGGGAAVTLITQIASGITGLAGFILLIVYVIQINDLKLNSQAQRAEGGAGE